MILGLILVFGIFWSKADDRPISRPQKISSKIKVLRFGLLSGKYGNQFFSMSRQLVLISSCNLEKNSGFHTMEKNEIVDRPDLTT